MFFLTLVFPIVYTALYMFAVLFLIKTKNEKFYQKILFSIFVVSAATWGWAELLQNMDGLRDFSFWFTKIGFAASLIGVEVLFLICLELLNLHFSFRRFSFFYPLLIFLPLYTLLPDFIVRGFLDLGTHLAIIAGYADFYFTTLVILISCVTLFLFLLVFKLNDQTTRKRISPIIFAFILTLLVGTFFNIYLPTLFGNEAFTDLAPLSTVTIVVALAYSISKWNLLGITFTQNVSYAQVSQIWKANDKKLHDQVREAFDDVVRLMSDSKVEIKKIVFLGGTVNKNGDVRLFHQNFIKILFVYYDLQRILFTKKIQKVRKEKLTKVLVIFKTRPGNLSLENYEEKIIKIFLPLSLYQRSVEEVISSHIRTNEKKRLI